MRAVILAVFMIGCGSPEATIPVNETLGAEIAKAYHYNKDAAGEQANFARKHASDRGFTVEGVNDRAVDKGFTKETTQDKLLATRKNAGEYANDKRKGVYRKGIKEMRHGDQDTQDTIRDNKTSSEEADQALAEATEAAIKALQDQVDVNLARLADLESIVAYNKEELVASVASLGADTQDKVADLLAKLAAAEEAREAADNALESSLVALIDSNIASLEAAVEAEIERLDDEQRDFARQTYRSLRHVQRSVYRNGRYIRSLARDVRDLERDVEDLEEAQCYVSYDRREIEERYRYYHGRRGHWHWATRWVTITIPEVYCGEDD